VPALPQRLELIADGGGRIVVEYRFDRDDRPALLSLDGELLADAHLHHASGELVDLEVDGRRRRYRVRIAAGVAYVNTAAGQSRFELLSRHPRAPLDSHPGSLAAPMPGAVARVLVAAGEEVVESQPLLILEAMKMEHEMVAPSAGVVVELKVEEGSRVEAGALLAIIEDAR
jgi:propionyl-CoA carboxylase alpha chain